MSVIIYAPQGTGKSQSKTALAAHFGLSQIVDGWKPSDPLPEDTLLLTNVPGVEGALPLSGVLDALKDPQS